MIETQETEIEKKLEDHENRLKKIEEKIFGEKRKPKFSDDFEGLNGGINLLIKNDFLNSPKSLQEINSELKKEGYYYGLAAIAKALSVYFMKEKRILTRVKDGKIWKYVVRK